MKLIKMSTFIDDIRFRLSFEFLFAVNNDVLARRLSLDEALSPGARPHSEADRSDAALVHLIAVLGRDQPKVTRNSDPRMLEIKLPSDRDNLDDSRWNALQAPQLTAPREGELELEYDSETSAGNSHVIGVELLSPYFIFGNWRQTLKTITRILSRLTLCDYPNLSGPEYRYPRHQAWTNARCSFRVRYDPLQDGHFFPLRTLKNLIAVWGTCEEQISKLHPPQHRYPAYGPYSLWKNMKEVADDKVVDEKAFRNEVYRTTNIPDLDEIVDFDKDDGLFSEISFKSDPAPSHKRERCHGIEFREHAGTLDIKDIGFWIGFTSSMLWMCQDIATTDEVHDFSEVPNVMDILEYLGASPQAQQYAWSRLVKMAKLAGTEELPRQPNEWQPTPRNSEDSPLPGAGLDFRIQQRLLTWSFPQWRYSQWRDPATIPKPPKLQRWF